MSRYIHQKPVKRSRYAVFRRYLLLAVVVIVPVVLIIGYILLNLRAKPSQPISAVQNTTIQAQQMTFTGPYFQFKDTPGWSLDKNDSTGNKFVYLKYNKNELQHQLNIYVNQVPAPLNLATPRVLPVRIVNNNSFDITNVSSPCGGQYAKDELHKVKEIVVNGATMLCDPDNSEYIVVLAEVNGDYRLNLKRPNGQAIQFVITYKDLGLDPQPDSLLNIASSFQTL